MQICNMGWIQDNPIPRRPKLITKIAKWAIGIAVAVPVLLVLVLSVGSYTSYDYDRQHTAAAASLPEISENRQNGHVRVSADGLTFRARIAGFETNPDGRGVILLHGFPVTSAMWDILMEPLEDAGYRVVAFDQRGYSPGARPAEVAGYTIDKLVSDVTAVADAAGFERFHLIGHDWGSVVGWVTVMTNPGRVITWTGISIAHPVAFGEALNSDPDQQSRSGYFALFQTPWLPEALFSWGDFMLLSGAYTGMTPSQQEEYLAVFSEPGALTAGLNWYRNIAGGPGEGNPPADIETPTLFIWGNNDPSAGRFAVEAQAKYMKGPYREMELDGGHWLLEEHADTMTTAIVEHLKSGTEL